MTATQGLHRLSGVASASTGGILLVGEDAPGSLLSSIQPGISAAAPTTVVNPSSAMTRHLYSSGVGGVIRRRLGARGGPERIVEAARQLEPDVVVIIKGRGLSHSDIREIQATGTSVACWYPDNPYWVGGDPLAHERLLACDLAIVFSERQADLLERDGATVAVLPFGYHPGWFPVADPDADREGIAFLGTWSPRRERYLSALTGLPLTIAGTGWVANSGIPGVSEPIVEHTAGDILSRAAIGVNLLHPQCEDAHNMRTREIAAAGALQLTDPGLDGTPLRDGESCVWFESPDDLRSAAEQLLCDRDRRVKLARAGQDAIVDDTYERRSRELAALCGYRLPE